MTLFIIVNNEVVVYFRINALSLSQFYGKHFAFFVIFNFLFLFHKYFLTFVVSITVTMQNLSLSHSIASNNNLFFPFLSYTFLIKVLCRVYRPIFVGFLIAS